MTADEVDISDGTTFRDGYGVLDSTIHDAELQCLLGGPGSLGGRKAIWA